MILNDYLNYVQEAADEDRAQIAKKHPKGPVVPLGTFRQVKPHIKDIIKTSNVIVKNVLSKVDRSIPFIPFDIKNMHKDKDRNRGSSFVIPGTILKTHQAKIKDEIFRMFRNKQIKKWELIENKRFYLDPGKLPSKSFNPVYSPVGNPDKYDYLCYLVPYKKSIQVWIPNNALAAIASLSIEREDYGKIFNNRNSTSQFTLMLPKFL